MCLKNLFEKLSLWIIFLQILQIVVPDKFLHILENVVKDDFLQLVVSDKCFEHFAICCSGQTFDFASLDNCFHLVVWDYFV